MAVTTTIRSFSSAFNSGLYGWVNVRLAATTGILTTTPLTVNGDIVLTPYQELPNLGYKCRITAVPLAGSSGRIGGRLILRAGDTVTWVAPTITTLTPNTCVHGGASQALTINGTGFVMGSVVKFGSSVYYPVFVSATQLTLTLTGADIAAAGTPSVTVTNPDGQVTAGSVFTIT
jgi:hypothetical protein